MSVMSVVMILHVVSVLKIDLSPRVVYVLRHVKMISMEMITLVYVPIVIQHVQHALEVKVPIVMDVLTVISNQINLQLIA